MDEDDDDATISRFLSDFESLHHAGAADADQCPAFSEASLFDLQSLLGEHAGRPRHRRGGRADGEDTSAALLWELLAARGIQASDLLRPLITAMDSSAVPRLTLVAARAYLSLLLCPSAPLYSLFNPLSFLSLLRALRRSLKAQNPSPAPGLSSSSHPPPDGRKNTRKRKSGRVRDAVSSSSPPSAERMSEVADLLLDALELLDAVLARVRLDAFPDGAKPLVETLTGIIESAAGHHRLPDLCFRILYSVVSRSDHGDQTISAVEVLRALTPIILNSAKSPSRASAVAFVTRRLVPLGRENDGVKKAVAYLPRFLVTKAPEKSEPRACAVDSILEVVHAMEQDDQCGFASYVVKMTQGKAQLRLLAVDLILALLTSLSSPEVIDKSSEDSWLVECLKALVQRCSDSVGGIRARALTNLGQVIALLAANQDTHVRLREVIGIDNAEFNQLLRRRCQDEKAAVRKAALILIMRSTALIGGPIDELLLKTMGSACSDSLVSIRKAAISALSEVFRRYPDERVLAEWLHVVPRLIVDNESSIQEECESLFLELVLDRISQAVKIRLGEDTTEMMPILPEGTLDLLKGTCDGEVALCIRKICASLGKKKKLKASVSNALQNIISMSESLWTRSSMPIEKWVAPPGSWQLLSEVSLFTPEAVEWEFLLHHWQLLDKGKFEDPGEIHDGEEPSSCTWAADRVSLLQTISNVSLELPPEPAAELASNLLEYLKDFNMHFSEVDAHVKALKTLCKRKASKPEEGDALVVKWVNQLLSKAVGILDKFVTEVSESGRVNTFFTPPQSSRAKRNEASSSKLIIQSATAVFTIGSLVLACPSADLRGIVPLLHTIITSENSEPKPKKLAGLTASFKEVAPSLYIQSWVTMGKICLVDDKLAKRYIPLFVQELERSDIAALRNNIMVIMTDFCVRYTALVDCYIPKITKSLRDSSEVVRRQTFILLSRLLQRDYVKWRGVLFLRFLLSLVDESEKIRHLADYLFGSILKAKAPLLAYNSFIEAIFILNDCHVHAAHSDTQGSMHRGPQLFSVRGNDEKSRSQRMHIYVSLLKQMAPEHLLATSAKLCAEILAAASDGLLNIDNATGQAVLQDALHLLSCKEMRIHPSRASDTNEMDDEGGDGGGSAALAAAKGRVVTQVAKKNLIQIAVPIFIELKRMLESKNSPLTGCLMECLRTLLKDFKNEIEEILVGDKQLQKELLYDMQKYETAKARSTVAETVATVQRSENYRSPNGLSSSVVYNKVSEKLGTGGKIASAVADAAARAKARSVLKEVNQNVPTPPLHTMSVPRLKTAAGGVRVGNRDRPSDVLESVRRRQSFESDEDN